MSARLFLEKGPGAPAVYELSVEALVTLGRHLSNSIVLQDEHASRWHAKIVHKDGAWLICDLGTRNGTRLSGSRIVGEAPIENGQEIAIGNSRLRFALEDSADRGKRRANGQANGARPIEQTEPETAILRVDELTALCSLMTRTLEDTEPRTLIHRALQTLLEQTSATLVGFLSLDADEPCPRMVLPDLARVDFQLSRYLTKRVQEEGRLVWLKPGAGSPSGEGDSLLMFTDAVCVPLRAEAAPLGALHVYRAGKCFHERDVRFCEILGGHLANSLRLLRLRRTLEAENLRLRGRSADTEEIVGVSPAVVQLRQLIARAAGRPSTVLITGESGVGKELVAVALHRQSPRKDGPLVVLNCAAVAPTLIEAELFGACKGAFTGADHDRPGLFRQADDGTLFLDEVGEMPLECQAKLLRVLETKRCRPVGGTAEIQSDVRIVAATNRDLERQVREGRFREDLYFRLCVIPIPVPPLRQHAEDIPLLVDHFLRRLSADVRHPLRLTPGALELLRGYSWPGNVRQLRSVLECSTTLIEKDTLDAADILLPADAVTDQSPPSLNLDDLETWAIRRALRRTGGNISQAARLLGVVRDTLRSKITKKGISKDEWSE